MAVCAVHYKSIALLCLVPTLVIQRSLWLNKIAEANCFRFTSRHHCLYQCELLLPQKFMAQINLLRVLTIKKKQHSGCWLDALHV